ncbi:hypothetical protein B7G54_21090 [Burkholderia puraquae]|uniref:Uncharacterized protein n=1 Tax=Burkholderia puraquae TaxID=1904757 RepID=A0A1X1PDD7_9BURK|nr:hypothetical protein [Burkholderia puraquae]ORT83939.1 hypothetical protein B7G54_21090 [Burkholderia puraquae]CAB3753660.1 hypothetical protein LMG29660_02156 [Burkholderia puraquae]
MSIRNRKSRQAGALGALGVLVKRDGRKARKRLAPNDRRYDHDVERTMRRLSPADLSNQLADTDDGADAAAAGFADVRRTP